ncbi:MAG: class I SAM-dependent methyltransferase, partial [Gemmatimonadaceae bacterium]
MTDGTAATAAAYFGSMADSYDSLIRRAVPRYDEMTARLIDYLPSQATRVLELGCGTGNLSLQLARRFPRSALTFVDGSAEMTGLTEARIRAAHQQVGATTYIVQRFEDLRFPAETFDLVVSSISLHHVEDKARLYRQLRSFMTTGGVFAFADQFRGD